ncbi:LOW QUALITY PROTEIN: hypothetical protein PHMEG_00034135 [Phytophthora megakarya]|uniref:Peptidase A2 domain-containing protein n=1 Tax=Phytophthora megakarya TaxID=4795 RepID=A0A225US92_9STRA|nr:LOW QUALITY PROTEIN: hypothetical protein PHMEG_00034135 [Phytophthora megakarya]
MGSPEDSLGAKTEGIASSVVQDTPRRRLNKEVRLLLAERMGWWSAQKFDRRVRMRTLVEGAVNDQRTRILLDTGANVSIVSARYAKKLGLRDIPNQDCSMDIQGISKQKTYDDSENNSEDNARLGTRVDFLLGTDFMNPVGVRQDMFHLKAKLPDEVSIPLIKTQAMKGEPEIHYEVSGPSATMNIPRREWLTFKVSKKHPSPKTHDVWIRRTESVVPTVTSYRKRWPYRVRLTNITDHTVYCPAHFPILAWVPLGHLPQDVGYVRLDSVKYTEWQVLAYAEARDKDLYKKEEKLYEQWLAIQPSAVARPEYTSPTSIFQHEEDDTVSDNHVHENRGDVQRSMMEESADIWVANAGLTRRLTRTNFPEATSNPNSGSDFMILEKSFISVVKAITRKDMSPHYVIYVHEPADVGLTDYAQELAFLPDFSDHSPTELDFSAANVLNSALSVDDQAKLVNVLKLTGT